MKVKGTEKEKLENIALIAGLGNSDAAYESTYHNVGMRVVGFLSEKSRNNTPSPKENRVRDFFEYVKTPQTVFIKPLGYMNESGKAIQKALHFFNVPPENMVVIHDDSDLGIGDFRTSFGSGSAGHKGVESVIQSLGTKNFFRIRIGIRAPEKSGGRRRKASELVLKKITREHKEQFMRVFECVRDMLFKNELPVQTERN